MKLLHFEGQDPIKTVKLVYVRIPRENLNLSIFSVYGFAANMRLEAPSSFKGEDFSMSTKRFRVTCGTSPRVCWDLFMPSIKFNAN